MNPSSPARAFVTIGVGPHAELLDIAMPSFERFCDQHDYDLIIPDIDSDRPPSWWKVPALHAALADYDEALFVGSDIVIIDAEDDVPIHPHSWHALVEHKTGDGIVPNADVWYVKRAMRPVLERVWERNEYTLHGWWEQASLMAEMGYDLTKPTTHKIATPAYERCTFLDAGWNVHQWDERVTDRMRFLHATMYPDRAEVMRGWAKVAEAKADQVTFAD